MSIPITPELHCAVVEPALNGESPMWHPDEQVLYYVDIPGHELRRFDPVTERLQRWTFDSDVACCAPASEGGMVLALRSGFWHFDPETDERKLIAEPLYDPKVERYNDGKCDAAGRFWCGTLYEPRKPPNAALYCLSYGEVVRKADGVTNSNGLGWSPDGSTMYWSDTTAHTIYALDFDVRTGGVSNRRPFAQFPLRDANEPLERYGGRPDGSAVDSEGNLWAAMFEGQRLVKFAPDGTLLREVPLPVRCPTMPCFGGPDLKTVYITTGRDKRPAEELAQQPWAGCVLSMRVDVPGLPANFARLD